MKSRATAARPSPEPARGPSFGQALQDQGLTALGRTRVETLQVNLGKLCNLSCRHCHVEAGPKRTEIMSPQVADRVVALVAANPGIEVVDLTGGAPELNPSFRELVSQVRALGRRVIDRCNLTVLFEPGQEDLAAFLAAHQVHVIASLPCHEAGVVDAQRGRGTFDKSIEALRRLCALGYGRPGSGLKLDLVYNPLGPSLPPDQPTLEAEYKEALSRLFGLEFNGLLTLTNMPIQRFAHALEQSGEYDAYMGLLVNHFNASTVQGVMCRSLLSVGWDGRLYDCDFNQMLELGLGASEGSGVPTLWDVASLDALTGAPVATGSHCFGCTAGRGSSCGGALQ